MFRPVRCAALSLAFLTAPAAAQDGMARMEIMVDMLIGAMGGEDKLVTAYLEGCRETGRLGALILASDALTRSGERDPAVASRLGAVRDLRLQYTDMVKALARVEEIWPPLDIDTCADLTEEAARPYEAAISAGDMASLRALISAPGSEVDQEKLQIGFHIASILSAGAEAAAAN